MKNKKLLIITVVVVVVILLAIVVIALTFGGGKSFLDFLSPSSAEIGIESEDEKKVEIINGKLKEDNHIYITEIIYTYKYKSYEGESDSELVPNVMPYVSNCIEKIAAGTETSFVEVLGKYDALGGDYPNTAYYVEMSDDSVWFVYDYYENAEAGALKSDMTVEEALSELAKEDEFEP